MSISNDVARERLASLLPMCPLCGSRENQWATNYDILKDRIFFQCGRCSSRLSMRGIDFTGANTLAAPKNPLTLLYTWQFAAVERGRRFLKGQKVEKKYIRVEEIGYVADTPLQESMEYALDEL